MSLHLEKVIRQLAGRLPKPIQIKGLLPQLPLLSLATQRDNVLFFGKYSSLLASRSFDDLQALYKTYLESRSVSYFLRQQKLDVTPKQFAEGLPYIVLRTDTVCTCCKGVEYIARVANRSAHAYPDGFYVEYACVNPRCITIIRGNDQFLTTRMSVPRDPVISRKEKPAPIKSKDSSRQNEVQRYLLAVIDAYVPEIKASALREYVKGNINLARVIDATGIEFTEMD